MESNLSQELVGLLLDRALARNKLRADYSAQAAYGLHILKEQWAQAKLDSSLRKAPNAK